MTQNSTARKPQASEQRCEAWVNTLSAPLFPKPAAQRFAEGLNTETLEEYSRAECLTGWYTQEIDV